MESGLFLGRRVSNKDVSIIDSSPRSVCWLKVPFSLWHKHLEPKKSMHGTCVLYVVHVHAHTTPKGPDRSKKRRAGDESYHMPLDLGSIT